jgi:hypothetical protein
MTEDELVYSPSSRPPHATHSDDSPPAVALPPAGRHLPPAEVAHFTRAHSPAALRTSHCERVRKMPLSGLDPGMLIRFVCREQGRGLQLGHCAEVSTFVQYVVRHKGRFFLCSKN